MAVQPIIRMGHPILLEIAQPITDFDTPELHTLIDDLIDTMKAANGAGLAAPQIGVSKQVVIFGVEGNTRYPEAEDVPTTVLINPTITPIGEEKDDAWEGCLSIPGMRGLVPRYTHIRYQGFDQFGKTIDIEAKNFHARVVQHEVDHLIGKLYPFRIKDMRYFGFEDQF